MFGKPKFKRIFNIIAITAFAYNSVYGYTDIEEQCKIVNKILKIEDSTESCCQYKRVTCDVSEKNVIQLNLDNLRFKYLTHDIINLPLIALDLSNNPKLKKLPKQIGKLAHLEILNLSDIPKLTKLPDSITLLKDLKILFLNNDTSLKELPVNFGNLSNLNQLYATSSGLTELPESFINLKKLVTANFSSSTSLYGEVPKFDTDVILNFYNTNVCYRKGVTYPEKWILPKDRYCETSKYY
eukprot:jgi/Orpsp1_1/1188280/evm.model.d7180000063600.1